ncbi:cytochrome c oxidase subunit II [halophilic archaeon]|nr:cytochrome c oxidase subunit II [halophilic archaeon]
MPGLLDALAPLHGKGGGIVPRGTRTAVFQQIFDVFLVLGTLVGVVVVSYMLYNAVKYRDGEGERSDEFDPPKLGELPSGSGGGRKLFLSFGLSTVIVVSLVAWTYGTLLYVEADSPGEDEAAVEVEVTGFRFGWQFEYPNGHTASKLRVPADQSVRLHVTSDDVFHTFGVPELRVKTDAIPGRYTDTWFRANETGTYEARCFELCGAGHSYMTAEVVVMPPDEYREWYESTGNETTDAGETNASASNDGTANASAYDTATNARSPAARTAAVTGGGAA